MRLEIWTLRKEATSITERANLEWEEAKNVFQDIDLDQFRVGRGQKCFSRCRLGSVEVFLYYLFV